MTTTSHSETYGRCPKCGGSATVGHDCYPTLDEAFGKPKPMSELLAPQTSAEFTRRVADYAQSREEAVNHPSHYGGDTTYETIKVLRAWLTHDEMVGFLKGNVVKYLSRANKKNGREDYNKATWYQNYLDKFIKEDLR